MNIPSKIKFNVSGHPMKVIQQNNFFHEILLFNVVFRELKNIPKNSDPPFYALGLKENHSIVLRPRKRFILSKNLTYLISNCLNTT